MRVIKLGIISAVFFALLITGISLFFPSHIRISKAIDINSSQDSVMAQLKNPVNWKKWYPGADTMQLLVIDNKVKGLVLDSMKNSIQVVAETDSTVEAETKGNAVRKATTGWNLYNSALPGSVTVQWYMDFHLRWYPWEKFSSLLLEKRYGPVMEKGLSNLKTSLEK